MSANQAAPGDGTLPRQRSSNTELGYRAVFV